MTRYYKKLCRALAYFQLGWNNVDFDSEALTEMEVFKLKRLLYLFENYGYHSETCINYKPKMKSLKLAIKLGERFLTHDYSRFTAAHDKKYGKLDTDFERIEGSDYYRMIDIKNGVKYTKTEEEVKDMLDSYRADEREQMRDRRNFYRIIEKYGRHWWD